MVRSAGDPVDTAIVGAGIFGLAIAHALCRDGAGTVALFDCGMPGGGDSRSVVLERRRHYPNPVTARLAMAGSKTIMDWQDEVGVADAGYVRCGYLLTGRGAGRRLRGNVRILEALGLETEFLQPAEGHEVEPAALARRRLWSAYEPDGGFADAQKMCLGWFAAGTRNGLRLASWPRGGCRPRAGVRAVGLETACGFFPAGRVVLTTGAWANHLLRPLGAGSHRAQAASCPRGPQRARWAASLGGWLGCGDERRRPSGPRTAVLRGRVRRRGSAGNCADDCDHGLSPGYEDAVRRGLRVRATPRLADFELVRGFAGPYDVTPDWNPIIGPCPGIEGMYLAVGWSGHGFKLSPAVGEVVAAEVSGRAPLIDVGALRPERFAEGRLLRLAYGPGARA